MSSLSVTIGFFLISYWKPMLTKSTDSYKLYLYLCFFCGKPHTSGILFVTILYEVVNLVQVEFKILKPISLKIREYTVLTFINIYFKLQTLLRTWFAGDTKPNWMNISCSVFSTRLRWIGRFCFLYSKIFLSVYVFTVPSFLYVVASIAQN